VDLAAVLAGCPVVAAPVADGNALNGTMIYEYQ
jgi:hypothetical protein